MDNRGSPRRWVLNISHTTSERYDGAALDLLIDPPDAS